MTTKVTVDAHAGWPVKVIPICESTGVWLNDGTIVPPHTTQDFFVWDDRCLLVAEVRVPRTDASPSAVLDPALADPCPA